jgi:hypothetical protein
MLVDKTFGFDTVVQEVVTRPLLAAKVGLEGTLLLLLLLLLCFVGPLSYLLWL